MKKLTEDERDYFEERAAIRQYDAGYSRKTAERLALEDLERYRVRNQLTIKGTK